jgi:hypothetical protein
MSRPFWRYWQAEGMTDYRGREKLGCFLVLLSLAVSSPCFSAEGEEIGFSINGTLITTYAVEGERRSATTNRFSVAVKGCECWIRVDRLANGILYEEYWWPETFSYNLTVYGTTPDKETAATHKYNRETGRIEIASGEARPKPLNDATLILRSEMSPDFTKSFLTPVWLAFGSLCFFQGASGDEYLAGIFPLGENPSVRSTFSSRMKGVKTIWRRSVNFPFFLEELHLLREDKLYFDAETLASTPVPESLGPYDAAYSYAVHEWTNAFGMTLPKDFRVTRRSFSAVPTLGADLERLCNTAVFSGRIESVTSVPSVASFVPEAPNATRVIDKRFAMGTPPSIRGIDYLSTNGTILSMTEVTNLRRFQVMARQGTPRAPAARQWIIVTLMALSMLPLVCYGTRFFKRSSER